MTNLIIISSLQSTGPIAMPFKNLDKLPNFFRKRVKKLDQTTEPCHCVGKVQYALKCSYIPYQIFKEFQECSRSKNGYVRALLFNDDPMSISEDMTTWVTTYHGAPVETIQYILLHDEMLMTGDVLLDGSYLERSFAPKDENPSIWTYPEFEGAEHVTKIGKFNNGEIAFQMVLELKQKPDSFTKRNTKWGYEIYGTNRRDAVVLWAVHIKVFKADNTLTVPRRSTKDFISTSLGSQRHDSCKVRLEARALKSLNIPEGVFEKLFDKCYCSSCYSNSFPKLKNVAEEDMVVPNGWVKFGVKVNESFTIMNDIWDCWNSAFHGCATSKVLSILKHRSLLIPGDYLYDGTQLGVNSSKDVNQKCYFFSPTIIYASHYWYAWPGSFEGKYFQTVLLFKVRPLSFDKQQETEGGIMKTIDDYRGIPEDEIEWCSSRRGCSLPYAILIRVFSEDEYNRVSREVGYRRRERSFRLFKKKKKCKPSRFLSNSTT